ncbi:MAG: response regulator [Planctomycetes bacterium]|nr:response regulator [Planctomycetota bacterium]
MFGPLAALVVIVAGSMLVQTELQVARTERLLAQVMIERTGDRVGAEFDCLIAPIERQLRTDLERVRRGDVPFRDPVAMCRHFLPVVRHLAGVESMMVGDATGDQLLLMRWSAGAAASPLLASVAAGIQVPRDGSHFFTRDFRLQAWGQRSRWTLFDAAGAVSVAEWELDMPDYDPRTRPWLELAMQRLREAEAVPTAGLSPIVWTSVYSLFTTKTAGVSASAAARGPDGAPRVVAYDLLLDDLQRFVAERCPTPGSKVVLCTNEGQLLAMSGGRARDPGVSMPQVVEVGGAVGEWARRWRDRVGDPDGPIEIAAEGQGWGGAWRPLAIGDRDEVWMGVLLPRAEVLALVAYDRVGYLLLVLAGFVAALLLANRFAQWIAAPLRQVVDLSRRVGRLDLGEQPTPASAIVELNQLLDSLVTMRSALRENIAARERAVEALRQAERMEAVGRLAGGVAHDINNLLTGILGHLSLALQQLPASHPAGADLRAARSAVDNGAAVVRQLLAFARRDRSEPRVIDVGERVRDGEILLRRLLREDIDLRITVGPGPHHVRIDPVQLQQVVVNLVLNARDAMPAGGRLQIDVDRRADAHEVVVVVADTGVGMSEQVLRHAFEPFFTTKAIGEGTGLGLSSCYAIVEQAGGTIRIDSHPGQGTRVTVTLPAAPLPEPAAEPPPAPAEVRGGRETVLCVEDEPAILLIVQRTLAARGYRVLVAGNGEQALTAAAGVTSIDLLLTDVVMHGIHGGELARRLRARFPGLRVLFISGYAGSVLEGRIPDGTSLLAKPFTPDELLVQVRAALDRATFPSGR